MKLSTKQFAVVMMGAPGSGKSTFAHNLMKQNDFTYVNYDTIRKELYGDESIQGSWKEISKVVDELISKSKGNIIVDGCHHTSQYRKEICKKLKENGYNHIVGVFVNSSLENCLKQNSSRSRQVPEDVIERIWGKLNEDKDELLIFFDELTTYDPENNTAKTVRNGNERWKSRNQVI
jgi:predicted kinase